MKNVNSDRAYEYIRKRILTGQFEAGRSLTTDWLSSEIGVSRTPIRDALRQLQVDGLVTIQARLGASVKRMDPVEFREMCGVRLALESYAAELAATQRTAAQLQEIKVALNAMNVLTEKIISASKEEPLLEGLRMADVRFHLGIITAASNELLKKEILRLHLVNRVVSSTGRSAEFVPEKKAMIARRRAVLASHAEIYAAIERRDGETARRTMADHIQDIVENATRVLEAEATEPHRPPNEDELSYQP